MESEKRPTKVEFDFGDGAYAKRINAEMDALKARFDAWVERKAALKLVKQRKKKKAAKKVLSSRKTEVDKSRLKAERAMLRAEKAKQKREKDALYTAKALEAFEAEDWNAGLQFARQVDTDDVQIQYWMGRFYEEGFLFERSPEASAEFYRDAAAQGHEDAKRRLDRMHIKGYGASFPEEAEWVSWKRCREAAERGDAEAQVTWGNILACDGEYEEAREWHVRAEKQKNPRALYCIGRAFESGRLIDNGKGVALQYYRDAAKLGDFAAMLRLKYHFKEDCELILPPDEELRRDFIKDKDGIYHKRVKTGPWLPVYQMWMASEYWCAVQGLHQRKNKGMSKRRCAASLFDKIFGKEGPEHEGYGTGALQKWADKMVKEGKDPHYVNLLEWFKGASSALDYHMGFGSARTFDELVEEQKQYADHPMRYMVEKMRDCIPQADSTSHARLYDAMKQWYYTIRYAPYGVYVMGDME